MIHVVLHVGDCKRMQVGLSTGELLNIQLLACGYSCMVKRALVSNHHSTCRVKHRWMSNHTGLVVECLIMQVEMCFFLSNHAGWNASWCPIMQVETHRGVQSCRLKHWHVVVIDALACVTTAATPLHATVSVTRRRRYELIVDIAQ